MIAKNYIKYPEALRFQVEMFSNGYHNSPRIMRLMEVIFKWTPTVPQWWKDLKAAEKILIKGWKKNLMELFGKTEIVAKTDLATTIEKHKPTSFEVNQAIQPIKTMPRRWQPKLQPDEYDQDIMTAAGIYRSFCQRHQGGYQGYPSARGNYFAYRGTFSQ